MGLIATDGCLSRDGRHVDITAKDCHYLLTVRNALGVGCGITKHYGSGGHTAHRLQVGSRVLYDRLLGLGLTPKKSLTLPALRVPDEWFSDFLRGAIDGDGNIHRWLHPSNRGEQWTVKIVGCSKPFLLWIQGTVKRLWRVTGGMHVRPPASEKHRPLYTLKFGKIAAKVILTECYYPGALALERKRALALECMAATVGWSQSKTMRDPGRWRAWKYVHAYVRHPKPVASENGAIDPAAGLVAESVST